MKKSNKKSSSLKKTALIAINVAIIILSSWICIPFTVNFTLQTLTIFIICGLFDFPVSMLSVAVYIALGAVGLPVFSSFGAGVSALFGPTGGFIFAFLTVPIIFFMLKRQNIKGKLILLPMLISQMLIYLIGALWFCFVYASDTPFVNALLMCVVPFIITDIVKIILATVIYLRLPKNNF